MDYSAKNVVFFFAVLLLMLPHAGTAQEGRKSAFFRNEFPEIWNRAKMYTLEVAEAMPAEYYDFSPTSEQLSFHDQLVHIAGNFYRLTGNIILEDEGISEKINLNVKSKKELIELLKKAFDFVEINAEKISDDQLSRKISFGGSDMTKERIFYLMRDHCTHHRAVAISYLRMKNIRPPRYRGW